MGDKVTVSDLTNILNSSGVSVINSNLDKLADEFDDVLYRDGSNSVTGDIDMDSNRILNLPHPISLHEPVSLDYLALLNIGGIGEKGDKGDTGSPGGNVSSIGLFTAAAGLTIPVGTNVVRTSGHSVLGLGVADYIYDATVNPAYVTANPYSSFVDAAGRGFKLDTSNGVRVEAFGADMTGTTVTLKARVDAWIKLAILTGKPALIGAGTLLLSATPGDSTTGEPDGGVGVSFILTNKTLLVQGAGKGVTNIRRSNASMTANGQPLLRFYAYAGGVLRMKDMTLDTNCNANFPPSGGDLSTNFDWQHNGCVEVRGNPLANYGFDLCEFVNIGIKDPVTDGISIRGGSITGAQMRRVYCENVTNDTPSLKVRRTRVRGDITITSVIDELVIKGGRFPRLHLERDGALSVSHFATVDIEGAQIGEFLAHNPGNSSYAESGGVVYPGTPERIRITVSDSTLWQGGQWGCGIVTFNNCRFHFYDNRRVRMTEGDHIYNNVHWVIPPGFVPLAGNESTLMAMTNPYSRDIIINGGSLTAEAGAGIPPWFMYLGDNGGGSTGVVRVGGGFHLKPTTMQLMGVNHSSVEVDDVRLEYAGVGQQSQAAIQINTPILAGLRKAVIRNVRMTNPAAKLLSVPQTPSAAGQITSFTVENNVCGVGKLIDFSTPGYGSNSLTAYGTGWTLEKFNHVSRVTAKPTVGDFVDGEILYLTPAAPSGDVGFYVTTRGIAGVHAVFAKLPALGAIA